MKKAPKKKEPKVFVGNNIKYFRRENNLTITDVAYHTGLSKAVLSQIENGITKRPSVQTAAVLANYFNCDLETLVLIELV